MGPAPSEAQLEPFGDARIWALYREMIQNRLRGELKNALRRSCEALSPAGLERVFQAWLVQAPPRSRPFHGIVEDFARFALGFVRADSASVAWAADLIAYEAALWAVSDMDDRVPVAVQELSFDAPPCFAPARRLVVLQHAVHDGPEADGSFKAGELCVCVYRPAEDKASRTFVLNPTLRALMTALDAGELTLTQAVQRVAQERKLRVDEKFIDGLCTVLADFSERGLLLGSRA
jgi:uncharacterized protein (DUF1501 family)